MDFNWILDIFQNTNMCFKYCSVYKASSLIISNLLRRNVNGGGVLLLFYMIYFCGSHFSNISPIIQKHDKSSEKFFFVF